MFVKCSRQNRARAKRQCRQPGAIVLVLFENLVTKTKRDVHQPVAGLRRAIGAEVGKETPADCGVAHREIRRPSFRETVLERDVTLVDIDAVMLAIVVEVSLVTRATRPEIVCLGFLIRRAHD